MRKTMIPGMSQLFDDILHIHKERTHSLNLKTALNKFVIVSSQQYLHILKVATPTRPDQLKSACYGPELFFIQFHLSLHMFYIATRDVHNAVYTHC